MAGKSLKTKEGFFSLLVFRGITFGTKFLKEKQHVFFPTLQSWLEAIKPFEGNGYTKEYLCAMNAYGQPSSQRCKENGQRFYWKAAENWVEAIKEYKEAVPFAVANKLISTTLKKDLFAFGTLTTLLLLGEHFIFYIVTTLTGHFIGDLVISKEVTPPTDEEFIIAFLKMDKGALAALLLLDLPLHGKSNEGSKEEKEYRLKENARIILQLYNRVKELLSQHNLLFLLPDIIHFEHLLCKISRCVGKRKEKEKKEKKEKKGIPQGGCPGYYNYLVSLGLID